MMVILLFSSLLLIGIGFIITEKNAINLLSGYNTMSEAERKEFDLKLFIPAFRKFHLFLGVSLFVVGTLFFLLIGEGAALVFMVVYAIVAYIWFIWVSKKYYKGNTNKWNKIGIIILLITLIGILILLITSFRENNLQISTVDITISGLHGEKIPVSDIETVCLSDSLPSISMRTNGFEMGDVRKGYFKTTSGEKVKFILNVTEGPFLVVTKKSGGKLYYSSGVKPIQRTFTEIHAKIPGKNCR